MYPVFSNRPFLGPGEDQVFFNGNPIHENIARPKPSPRGDDISFAGEAFEGHAGLAVPQVDQKNAARIAVRRRGMPVCAKPIIGAFDFRRLEDLSTHQALPEEAGVIIRPRSEARLVEEAVIRPREGLAEDSTRAFSREDPQLIGHQREEQ